MDPVIWYDISRKTLIAASIIAALGSIVAATGGYGILYFGRKISDEQKLKISQNNKEAASAKENAAIANQKAAEANVKASTAEQNAASANERASKANENASEANEKAKLAEAKSIELEVQGKRLTLEVTKAKKEAEQAKLERDRIKLKTLELQKKSKLLEQAENKRSTKEIVSEILKRTKPEIDAKLVISDSGELIIVIEMLKQIPFRMNPFVSLESNGHGLSNKIYTTRPEVHPKEGIKFWEFKYSLLSELKYVQDKPSEIKLFVDFESIYMEELNDPKMKGTIEKNYIIDIKNNVILER